MVLIIIRYQDVVDINTWVPEFQRKIREQAVRREIARNCGITEASVSTITAECHTSAYSFAL